jgi:hypothetical protein
LWCTSESSQVETFERLSSNRVAPRQAARNASCTTSSASAASRTIRIARPYATLE